MRKFLTSALVAVSFLAQAEMMDRPSGVKIGQRMTLKPYVSFYYTWDTNPNSIHNNSEDGQSWVAAPGLGIEYRAETWNLMAGLWYRYHAYSSAYRSSLDRSDYGESLAFHWASTKDGGAGWTFMLEERFFRMLEDNDMTYNGGVGNGRNRTQFEISAALNRRLTDALHMDVNGSQYYLDYDNDPTKYCTLYGWQRWTVGVGGGYVLSKWFDALLQASYQQYNQDNAYSGDYRYSGDSQGYTVHAGFGSYLTERINYRLTGGWTRFCYGTNSQWREGLTYTGHLNWRMSSTWQMMFLASGSYHPSEYAYGTSSRTDSVSWGLEHVMVQGKLNATLDITYRFVTSENSSSSSYDYDQHNLTGRFGLNYILNRFVSVFGTVEYHTRMCDDRRTTIGSDYDYNRLRASIGFRLTY